jgi:hypothetical protein
VPYCGQCGAPVGENDQCPQCGTLCAGIGAGANLDIDEGSARAPKTPGALAGHPSAAQIGGEGIAATAAFAEPAGSSPAPLELAERQSLSYEAREHSNRLLFWRLTRAPVVALLAWFTASYMFLGATWVFIDYVNILIHEAGHVAFSWDGETLHALGGTLAQLIMPGLFVVYFFWWRRERFAAVVCLWWFAENLPNIAIYMKDAPTEELPLLGGGEHDWAFLMRKWDLMHRAQDIAEVFYWIGLLTMLGTLLILAWWTWKPTSEELAPPVE